MRLTELLWGIYLSFKRPLRILFYLPLIGEENNKTNISATGREREARAAVKKVTQKRASEAFITRDAQALTLNHFDILEVGIPISGRRNRNLGGD